MIRGFTHLSHTVGPMLLLLIGVISSEAVYAAEMTTERTREMTMKFLDVLHSGDHV